jgi:hypothetical protein
MAVSIPPHGILDEAAERRRRTEGLLRKLRVQADISQEHRRVASEPMAELSGTAKGSRRANVDDRPKPKDRRSRALPQD